MLLLGGERRSTVVAVGALAHCSVSTTIVTAPRRPTWCCGHSPSSIPGTVWRNAIVLPGKGFHYLVGWVKREKDGQNCV